jgi:Tfp pilus assembly protein PilF
VSLLMEALEKAEKARRQSEDRMSPKRSVPHETAAREVFAARRPNALALIVGAGLFALLGVGGYFWWQLRAIGPPGAARLTAAPPVAAQAPAIPPAPATPSSPSLEISAPALPIQDVAPPLPAEIAAPAVAPAARAPKLPVAAPADSPRRESSDAALALRFTRTVPELDPTLERAYEALQAGRDDEARRAYEQALRADGKNADALLGLATLAVRRGETDAAHVYYLRALEADPSDATARAGVLGAARHGDEAAAESQLKTALSEQPGSPPLNFALGNLYARQGRWSEAQPAYFQAYAGDPDNPDLLFNLAVSLDHLRQGRLAARYYRMALEASAIRTASFARDAVDARLLELK